MEEMPEEMVIPTDREVEEANVNTEEPGVKGTVTVEAEQPLLTAEEVERDLAATISEAEIMELDVAAQEFENGTTVNVEENPNDSIEQAIPIEGIETNTTILDGRDVVIVTDEEDETEKVPPSDETTEARAAAVRTYQRRPAREETSEKKIEEEQTRETLRQKTNETVESPARSAADVSRRRRRLLIDEEPEEEEDVSFTPMDVQPSQVPRMY